MNKKEFNNFLKKEFPEIARELGPMSYSGVRVYLNKVTGLDIAGSCLVSEGLQLYKDALEKQLTCK